MGTCTLRFDGEEHKQRRQCDCISERKFYGDPRRQNESHMLRRNGSLLLVEVVDFRVQVPLFFSVGSQLCFQVARLR